jgi:hypothetical protein
MQTTFKIWVRTRDGKVFEAFSWCKGERAGIARARVDARIHGIELSDVWAVPA